MAVPVTECVGARWTERGSGGLESGNQLWQWEAGGGSSKAIRLGLALLIGLYRGTQRQRTRPLGTGNV